MDSQFKGDFALWGQRYVVPGHQHLLEATSSFGLFQRAIGIVVNVIAVRGVGKSVLFTELNSLCDALSYPVFYRNASSCLALE